MNLFTKLFTRPRINSNKRAFANVVPRAVSLRPLTPPVAPPLAADNEIDLAISKIVNQLAFIDRSYDLQLFPNGKENFRHDLALMHAHRDLKSVSLELVGADQVVLFEFKVEFNGDRISSDTIRDAACGIELPMLDRKRVKQKRMLVNRSGIDQHYRDRLKLRWTTAETLKRSSGTSFRSDHAAKISGGRQAARFHVSNQEEHRLLVVQTGTQGFAFARDLALGVQNVYCHADFAPPDHRFEVGQRLTAIVVQTPKGLQARNIRVA